MDDPDLDLFWQAADDLGSLISIHPVFDAGDDRVKFKGMEKTVGRITDTLIAGRRTIYSGHVARYANASLLVGIGGSALPYLLGRPKRNHALHQEESAGPELALSVL